MTRKPSWFSLVLALSLVVTGPATIFAQDNADDENGATKIYLPHLSSPAQVDVTTNEFEDDEAPAVLEAQLTADSIAVSAASALQGNARRNLAALQLDLPRSQVNVVGLRKISPDLRVAQGTQKVVVRLRTPSVLEQMQSNVAAASVAAQQAQLAQLEVEQADVIQAALSLDASAQVLGSTQKALNAVMLQINGATLAQLAANPAVLSVKPVVNYTLDLTDTVPYIGGTAVQTAGYNGKGVKVAVVDSGIDYLHANLGGAGDPAEFAANDPTVIEAGTFPTAKVVGGYDFVGSGWPGTDEAPVDELPDADPLDDGPDGGHGTHVADIIGGKLGVAPAVDLYALKVCSSIANTCSGIGLLQAMDFAVDPDGDGDLSDKMDIVNMSLGSNYGQVHDDDLSQAVENISAAGVLVVASAGNSADKPYVTGSPAAAPSALSVAQTQVPTAIQPVMDIVAPAAIAGQYPATLQEWSAPLVAAVEGPAQYADGAGGNLDGCVEFAAGTLTGKIVLVDRGGCNISVKISNIAVGGALAGIVGLIAPGDPTQFSFGGGNPSIPGFNITQAHSTLIKRALAAGAAVTLRFDPNAGIAVVKHMVGSSSRGPSMLTNLIKPEIGAPGASISAIAGTGSSVEAFGGTSGAAPMVSGAAAQLVQAYPDRSPAEIKALLMNTGETEILNKPLLFGGYLAAITRIGGGEVRADRALKAAAAAWDANAPTAALNFTFHDITKEKVVLKRVVNVRNYSDESIEYEISGNFRYANDAATEAIEINTPDDIRVPAHGDKQFEVTMIIRGKKLLDWALNSGSRGANADVLTLMEMDGYLTLTDEDDAANNLHLPWHILPRKAGDVTLKAKSKYVSIRNRGVATTTVEAYSLLAVSPNAAEGPAGANSPQPDLRYVGYTTFGVPAGFCSDAESFIMGFAINTWERQTHANAPAEFDLFIDLNQDGETDLNIFNFDLSLSGNRTDGRNVVWVVDLVNSPTVATPVGFVDHDTNSANSVFYLCAEDMGLSLADAGKPIDLVVTAADVYFSAFRVTDAVEGITIAAGGEKYVGVFDVGGAGLTTLGRKQDDKLRVLATGSTTNNTENGLLLLYRGGAPEGKEAGVVIVQQ